MKSRGLITFQARNVFVIEYACATSYVILILKILNL